MQGEHWQSLGRGRKSVVVTSGDCFAPERTGYASLGRMSGLQFHGRTAEPAELGALAQQNREAQTSAECCEGLTKHS